MKFRVNIKNTEYGFYEVEADSAEQAEETYFKGDLFINKNEEEIMSVEQATPVPTKEEVIEGLRSIYNDHSLTDKGEAQILVALEHLGFDIREV